MELTLKKGAKVVVSVEEPLTPTNVSSSSSQKTTTTPATKEQKTANRFYLPVLGINNPANWPSKPTEEREKFTDQVGYDTCLGNCCGVSGLMGACCQLDQDDLEHVLGPVTEQDIERIMLVLKKARMKPVTREDVVIDFEEGRLFGEKFFNGHPVFSDPKSYPILRLQVHGLRFACKFLNTKTMKCSIYEHRPHMCRAYYCEYIKGNFLINIKGTYQKVR